MAGVGLVDHRPSFGAFESFGLLSRTPVIFDCSVKLNQDADACFRPFFT